MITLQYYLAILLIAVIIDILIGEPKGPLLMIHPVVLCGRIVDKLFRPGSKYFGVLLWFTSVIPLTLTYYLLPRVIFMINTIAGMIIYAYVLKLTFSIKLMRDYVKKILKNLEAGDLEGARSLTQEIVRRNVWRLDEQHIISAIIESMSESFVDGILSPLFYYAILGLPGSLLQRLSNTMDSMVGYKGWPYEGVGWFSAMIDTVLNYIPSRISVIIFTISSALLGLNWRNSVRVALLNHNKVPSKNSGWPMASFAGALGITLEKVGRYRINDGALSPNIETLRLSLRLFDVSIIITLIIISLLTIIRILLIPLFI
jgi:adenosylcobinamide-phosphate synthase|nr:MAG: cobalamin biosynthesis protein CobD [Vulcanisaeta sp. AZ3]